MSLTSLGLTSEQEGLYRQLLRRPPGADGTAVAEGPILAELQALGLVDETHTAVPPAVAIDLLVRQRIEQTQRRLGELSLAWDLLTELAEEHRSGRPVQLVEHLLDGDTVTRRMCALLDDEPGESIQLKERAFSGNVESPFNRLLAHGLHSRTLFSVRALEDPVQEPYARKQHAKGDLHRVTAEPIRRLAIINRSVAFVQADPANPLAGALQIRQHGVVAILADVFDGMWTRGCELDGVPLSPVEQQVLHALTCHGTDEAAARSVNVSVRKFRAHVAEIMDHLGAETRFQAAMLAKERGWL
jgi:DNA-binding CsgD family transcriptional regulator